MDRVQRSRASAYAPLLSIALILFLALAILPSALNLPQSNPSTTLEYAPVPPADKSSTPPGGNLTSLGLASSGTLGAVLGDGAGVVGGGVAGGVGKNPITKRCVGNPPRQTEDPMSPPCVAYFNGDNGGATYQGVTRDEIIVVEYLAGGHLYDGARGGVSSPPAGTFCDTELPADTGGEGCLGRGTTSDHYYVTWIRAFARSLNDRFQLYGRHVHMWVQWANDAVTPETRRAEAANVMQKLKPFAIIDQHAYGGLNEEYDEGVASRGALLFSSLLSLPQAFFQKHAPRIWSFRADIEHRVDAYVDYVCTKVAPFKVSHSTGGVGNDGTPFNGRPRKYAFLSTHDPDYPGLRYFAKQAKAGLAKCGVTPAVEVSFTRAGYGYDTGADPAEAAANVAKMKQTDATTVLWLQGAERQTGVAADQAQYYPEIVIAGDGVLEGTTSASGQNANWLRNAWANTDVLRQAAAADTPGYQTCRDGDPNAANDDVCVVAIKYYRDFFSVFQGIQIAGPKLTPQSVDKGFHAIPKKSSTSPFMASCYYDPGDYSCVKDSIEQWWDQSGQVAGVSTSGCYRMRRSGQRFLPGTWPAGDDVFINKAEPCNAYAGTAPFGAPTTP